MSNINYKNAKHWDTVLESEFSKESDRASVILTASILDDALLRLIKCNLVPCPSTNDDLFDSANSPLATFSARIAMAHRLGILSSRFCRDLHLIRKIRNEFAHNIHGCDFTHSSVRSRVLELSKSSGVVDGIPEIRKKYEEGPRGDFLMCCSLMLWHINCLIERAVPKQECDLESCYSLNYEKFRKALAEEPISNQS